mgnify:CR=1 FL=1
MEKPVLPRKKALFCKKDYNKQQNEFLYCCFQDVPSGLSAPGSPCRPSRTQSYKSASGTWPATTDHEILRENVTAKVEVEVTNSYCSQHARIVKTSM